MLSQDKPHPRTAAECEICSTAAAAEVGGGIDELDGFVAQRRSTAAVSSEDEPYTDQLCLTRTGDLVPTCQPAQIARMAKSETYMTATDYRMTRRNIFIVLRLP